MKREDMPDSIHHANPRRRRAPQFGFPGLPRPAPGAVAQAKVQRVRSEDWFRDGVDEIVIEHRGECYRLRRTRQDKLILDK